MSRRRRSEILNVNFVDGLVEGWAFGVGEFFRTQLDIRLDERVDTVASRAKQQRLGRPLLPPEKVIRRVWTQGDPPAYCFDRGHVFHELAESAEGLKRSLVVVLARPDPDALVEVGESDDEGQPLPKVVAAPTSRSKTGFVDYEVLTYRHGVLLTDDEGGPLKERYGRTQAAFVELLRTGR